MGDADARYELLDRATVTAQRQRIGELEAREAEAEADVDLGSAERLRLERDLATGALARELGLTDEGRGISVPPERAAPPCARRSSGR